MSKDSPIAISIPDVVLAEMQLTNAALAYASAVSQGRDVQQRREQLALAALHFGNESARVRRALLLVERSKP